MTSASTQHPPKPNLVLRVGITGHRPNRLENEPAVKAALGRVLEIVSDATARVHQNNRSSGQSAFSEVPPTLQIVSALAEGTDQFAARQALDLGYGLQCPIPFSEDDYLSTFDDDAGRAQYRDVLQRARQTHQLISHMVLPGSLDAAPRAFEAVGFLTVRQSDLLITVWDGNGQGGRGGSMEIISTALNSGLGVIWIKPDGTGPFLLNSPDDGFIDPRDEAERVVLDPPADDSDLSDFVAQILSPPSAMSKDDVTKTAGERLDRFFNEREFRIPDSLTDRVLAFFGYVPELSKPSPHAYEESAQSAWSSFSKPLHDAHIGLPEAFSRVLQKRYAWADNLALLYSRFYRASYTLNYVLAVIAVLFALLPLAVSQFFPGFANDKTDMATLKAATIFIELIIILAIIFNTVRGSRFQRWDLRWLDYRLLAEQLRHHRSLMLTGSRLPDVEAVHAGFNKQPGIRWVSWYLRATTREVPLPSGPVDDAYAQAISRALTEGEVQSQIDYHEANAKRMKRLDDNLELGGLVAFGGTIVVASVYLIIYVADRLGTGLPWPLDAYVEGPEYVKDIVTFITAFLPALGGAFAAIRNQADCKATAQRSEQMASALKDIKSDIAASQSFSQLSASNERMASLMLTELSDWRFVFRNKPITLPM